MSIGRKLPTLRRILVPPFSESRAQKRVFMDVGNCLPIDTA